MIGEIYDIEEIIHSFLWISWHHIGKLLEEVLASYKNFQDECTGTIYNFLSGCNKVMEREGFYPVKMFRTDDLDEIYIDNYFTIPVLKAGIESNIIEYESFIDPSLIPTFKYIENHAVWLTKKVIEPDIIQVITGR
jgi:hypothetical protein